MSLHDHAIFQVTIKTLLHRDGEILALTTQDGYVDFPGGRIDKSEVGLATTEVLHRELSEELGKTLEFSIQDIAFISKRQYNRGDVAINVLAIYYNTEYIRGDVVLSDEHAKYRWIKPTELLRESEKFMSQDEFVQFGQYISRSITKS